MKRIALALIVSGCVAGWVGADSWSYPARLIREEFKFGRTRVVLDVDGRRNQDHPPHKLSIYLGYQLMARYVNVGFGEIYASPDNQHFVGVSNEGIPGTAFVVFDAQGNLLREVKHQYLPHEMYTEYSVTLSRTWFDDRRPEVEFKMNSYGLESIFINGSNKQRYDLLEVDLGFRPKDAPAESTVTPAAMMATTTAVFRPASFSSSTRGRSMRSTSSSTCSGRRSLWPTCWRRPAR